MSSACPEIRFEAPCPHGHVVIWRSTLGTDNRTTHQPGCSDHE